MGTYIFGGGSAQIFYHEKSQIRSKFSSAGYRMRFVNSVINGFEIKEHDP